MPWVDSNVVAIGKVYNSEQLKVLHGVLTDDENKEKKPIHIIKIQRFQDEASTGMMVTLTVPEAKWFGKANFIKGDKFENGDRTLTIEKHRFGERKTPFVRLISNKEDVFERTVQFPSWDIKAVKAAVAKFVKDIEEDSLWESD